MNLKEGFRYQSFLESLMSDAIDYITNKRVATTTTRVHNISKVNADGVDREEVEDKSSLPDINKIILLAGQLIEEKSKLTQAIQKAKQENDFDIDASIESNKFRQKFARAIRMMMSSFFEKESKERGTAYKFNVEGNETPYSYDITVKTTEDFDREKCKLIFKDVMSESDRISGDIDKALVMLNIDYDPPFDVNSSFMDIIHDL